MCNIHNIMDLEHLRQKEGRSGKPVEGWKLFPD